jgi:hypothetical protein
LTVAGTASVRVKGSRFFVSATAAVQALATVEAGILACDVDWLVFSASVNGRTFFCSPAASAAWAVIAVQKVTAVAVLSMRERLMIVSSLEIGRRFDTPLPGRAVVLG